MAAPGQPPKKKSNTILFVALGCVGLLALGCCGYFGWAYYAASSAISEINDAVEEANNRATEASGGGGGGDTAAAPSGNVCTRAAECCEQYISAMGAAAAGLSVETTCAGYRNLASVAGSETGCQSAIDGYRSGLSALGHTVPAACQ